ncbi:Hypothetical predicted protein, partial [Olea europaea subsp. europaea]
IAKCDWTGWEANAKEVNKVEGESDDKFWYFARRFFFGLWGFQQWPYPPGRPI